MRMKKILSILFVCCIIMSMLSTVSFAENDAAATNYHIFTALPTEESAVTSAALYWGAPFVVDGANVFYGMNSMKQGSGSSTHYTATNEVSQQYTMTVRYAGKDDTYGDYYNLVFTQPSGTAYAVAYDSRIPAHLPVTGHTSTDCTGMRRDSCSITDPVRIKPL